MSAAVRADLPEPFEHGFQGIRWHTHAGIAHRELEFVAWEKLSGYPASPIPNP